MSPNEARLLANGINLALTAIDMYQARQGHRQAAELLVKELIDRGEQVSDTEITAIFSRVAQDAIDEARDK